MAEKEVIEMVDGASEVSTEQAPAQDFAAKLNEDDTVEAESDAEVEVEEDELDTDDSLTYSNGVIEKIVGMKGNLMHFVQEQFGAENLTKGVTVEVTDDNRVVVNISVIIEYGAYAPDIFDDVKTRVTERLAAMTGLEVAGINLRIDDVVTPEEYAERQKHLIDNLKADDED